MLLLLVVLNRSWPALSVQIIGSQTSVITKNIHIMVVRDSCRASAARVRKHENIFLPGLVPGSTDDVIWLFTAPRSIENEAALVL